MTMTNAEWMIKNGYKFSNLFVRRLSNEERNKFVVRYNNEKIDYFELNECHISFSDSAYKKWLDMEHKEPILDDAERKYLSAVIRPFRNRVQYIEKVCADHLYCEPDYYICIRFNDGNYDMNFPFFDESHMYKCMEINRPYTLEELWL